MSEKEIKDEALEVNDSVENQEEIKTEENKIEELNLQLTEEKGKYLRLFAEFENYKRRTQKEKIDLIKTANEDLIQKLLPVLDDFSRGMKEIKASKDENLIKGVELIQTKLSEILKNKGLESFTAESGAVLDTDFHNAITQIPAPSEDLKGKIIDCVETGYKLKDKVIRFAKVVVGM